MKIIFGGAAGMVREHARRLVAKIDSDEHSHPHAVRPRGVPAHLAQHPVRCEECGETFWASDPYSMHVGCRSGRKGVGF